MDNRKNAVKLQTILQLKNQPVAIKLLKENKEMPGYDDGRSYTFCQYIMKAQEGNKLLANGTNISCANGLSALGFREVPEKLLNGEFLERVGSFKKEGAIKTMEMMPRFELNKFAGIALAPLAEAEFEADIIVLETVPEHLMWLALATLHQKGGRLAFSSSISNGTCVDSTVVPYQTQKLNVSLGCYGCRNATNIPDEHLIAGFPGHQLQDILDSLDLMSEKALPRTREKRAYSKLTELEKA